MPRRVGRRIREARDADQRNPERLIRQPEGVAATATFAEIRTVCPNDQDSAISRAGVVSSDRDDRPDRLIDREEGFIVVL